MIHIWNWWWFKDHQDQGSPRYQNLMDYKRINIIKMATLPKAIHRFIVQFSHSVVSNSSWPHEPQHIRPPCPSPTPRVHPNPCPLSRWCHPTILSSVVPFSSCPQSFPASGSFQMSQLFTLGGQSIGVSASTSVLPMNTQDWSAYPGWTGWCDPNQITHKIFHRTRKKKS